MTTLKPKYKPFPMNLLSQPDNNLQTYTGNCHCGHIQFTVTISPPFPEHQVASCNCSICRRNGYLLIYPLRENVTITKGDGQEGQYRFNRRKATHKFCGRCGSSVFVDFNGQEAKDVIGVNVRLLNGVDLDDLALRFVDGASHPGEYRVD
ncbi:glutathione-dependent formaldehyde-activating enzyme domain-containing protein [Pochonia chlamydosporia 170]|uniref:Glutathione-dependent formaldehyde-activating enzyme domain-containing protein n=1 Tax=Pochonia chlamydosporia 170 TaxID=1380566 RepID=A0A179FGF8_METCM|nr:glutathione-dependent formaldehyde-activating enzyme domain-containing protein [Pochonia chlamydosporia 170]OAQ64624.1 glutathione-dependent formaldehyde-activating enzyme domain-containing protein [Pochonia chlamydosporia 170]